MTITLILSQPPAYSETFFRSKINGLEKSGHTVLLVTGATSQSFDQCRHLQHPTVSKNMALQTFRMLFTFISLVPYFNTVVKYLRLEKKEGTTLKRSIEKLYINATLLKLKTDWIHFGFATMAIDRELIGKAVGAKTAVSFRGYDIGVYPLKNPSCYDILWKYIDQIHYISDDLYGKAVEAGLSSAVPHFKITPAINTDHFQTVFVPTTSDQKSLSILTIGRLHWKKGFIDTLNALYQLKEKGVEFTFKIIGDGPDYERIAFAAYQLGLYKQVVFLGKLKHDQVKEELIKADIYIQYSIQEGFCNAVLEAQALGKLCIVSNAEGLAENVMDGHTGFVVPRLQPQLLAQKIMEVTDLSSLEKERISQQAIQRVKKDFNLEQQKEKFDQFYHSLHTV
jgi:colanic acid/amylovoran biosynthesis glycosyltransferase